MHGYPVMQVVQYSVPPQCPWAAPVDIYHAPSFGKDEKIFCGREKDKAFI